jgi:hypothetical protein
VKEMRFSIRLAYSSSTPGTNVQRRGNCLLTTTAKDFAILLEFETEENAVGFCDLLSALNSSVAIVDHRASSSPLPSFLDSRSGGNSASSSTAPGAMIISPPPPPPPLDIDLRARRDLFAYAHQLLFDDDFLDFVNVLDEVLTGGDGEGISSEQNTGSNASSSSSSLQNDRDLVLARLLSRGSSARKTS